MVAHGTSTEEREASKEKARKELANLAKHKERLWIDTFVDIAKYGQERDTATLTTRESSTARIAIGLEDRMRNDLFDYPLTLKVRLPDTWKTLTASQNGRPVKVESVVHEGRNYALVEAVPDRGNVVLAPKE